LLVDSDAVFMVATLIEYVYQTKNCITVITRA